MRGLGIGILITTIVLSFGGKKEKLTDKEIIARAGELGMVMKEEDRAYNLEEVLEQSLEKVEPEIDLVEGDKDLDLEEPSDEDEEPSEQSNVEIGSNIDTNIDANMEANIDADTDINTDIDTGIDTDIEVQEPLEEDVEADTQEPSEEDTGENVSESSQVSFTIVRGMSSRQVSELLAEKGLIDDAVDFDDYIKRQGKASVIRIGTYTLPKGSAYQAILNAIAG